MNNGGEAADEMVKYYFEAIKCAAVITGKGAEHALAILLNELKNNKQTKGKTRLNNMLKSGKPLKIFTMQKKDLAKFTKEAKSYGVLYCALVNRKNKDFDDMVDILVRQEDASKIDRIVERFKLTTSNPAHIKTEIVKEMAEQEVLNKGIQTKSKIDLEEDNKVIKPLQKEVTESSNFAMAKTEASRPFEPYSKISKEIAKENRKSVRAELKEIKEDIKEKNDLESKDKTVTKTKKKTKTK